MKTRKLGKHAMELSEIALGTWGLATNSYGPPPAAFQGKTTEQAFEEVVTAALDKGITTFDLAPLWGDGFAETTVAKVVGAARRDKVQYITRAGAAWKRGRAVTRFEAYDLIADCEASLKRLQTDYIDIWLLHNPPDYVLGREEWMTTARRLKDDGKIRAWGVSVGDDKHAKQVITSGADVLCLAYNALHTDDLHALSNDITAAGTGVLARSPLNYGMLAGKWSEGHTFSEKDHRQQRWSAHALRTRIKQVENLKFLVHGDVKSMTEAALRYVLANQLVTSAIVGARSEAQLAEAVQAADHDVYLPSADLHRIPEAVVSATR